MPVFPDLQALRDAADIVDATAESVESDAANVDLLLEGLPWTGRRREVLGASVRAATGIARRQASAERDLARALRQLALEVQNELAILQALAERARRHLEDLLRQALARVERAAHEVASAVARGLAHVAAELATLDAGGAVREAREMAARAKAAVKAITEQLRGLPDAADPIWRILGPSLVGWQPR